jgi:DNA (cytosine-5)-methyltransferase 1
MQQLDDPILLFVDLFCGAGGITTAIEHAEVFDKRVARVLSCVNHDKNAIATHALNHPHCEHFTEDIRSLNVSKLVRGAQIAKQQYPNARLCLWASLECTHFSKARGALPRDADSRTLAEHLYRYLDAFEFAGIPFEAICIENVEEFKSWGPLDARGKPISKDKGIDYVKWVEHIKRYNYEYDDRTLDSADYGAFTRRKRYFGIFCRPELPIVWPKPTHARKPAPGQQKWNPVREVLDLDIMGENIFWRKKPLAEATLQRVLNGMKKHFNEDHQAFLDYYYGHGYSSSLDNPSGTLTTKDRINLVHFLLFPQWGAQCSHSIYKPSPVLPARMDKMYVYKIDFDKAQAMVTTKADDSEQTRAIKTFMIERGVREVRMRPLSIAELLRITGLDNYQMVGTIAEQKKYIGNAVVVQIGKALIESFALAISRPGDSQQIAAA